jgi:hypothetical protein
MTTQGGGAGGGDVIRVPEPPQVARQPVQRRLTFRVTGETLGREIVRALLALAALALVFWTVLDAYAATQGHAWAAAKEWLQVVLPAETGILGSVLGFYFGTHAGERRAAARGSSGN